MISYIFRSMWKQKKSNLFIIIEMFGLFNVLFFCFTETIPVIKNKFAPNALEISEDHYLFTYRNGKLITDEAIKEFVRQFPEIENVSVSFGSHPYNNSSSSYSFQKDSTIAFETVFYQVDAEFAEVFNVKMLKGEWFPKTKHHGKIPVVVTKNFAERLGKDAIGTSGRIRGNEVVIVGVTEQYRSDGYNSFKPGIFLPFGVINQSSSCDLSIQLKKEIDHKAKVIQSIRDFLKDNDAKIYKIVAFESLQKEQEGHLITSVQHFLMLIIFLLTLTALSLSGTFGYTIKHRAAEIAIYRSLGGSTHRVRNQLMGEILTLTLMGCIPAIVIVLQIPLLGIFTAYDEVLLAVLLSTIIIFSMVVVSIYFPSRLACRLEPGLALKAE